MNDIIPAIVSLIATIPKSTFDEIPDRDLAKTTCQKLVTVAAMKTATISGGMALPPGPIGLVTILPELKLVWLTQTQLVSDIAAIYGKTISLDQQAMLYCLFKHGLATGFKEIVVRVGERYLIKRASLRAIQALLKKIGVSVTQRLLGRSVSRWLPIIGAGAIAAFSYKDTTNGATTVASTAGAAGGAGHGWFCYGTHRGDAGRLDASSGGLTQWSTASDLGPASLSTRVTPGWNPPKPGSGRAAMLGGRSWNGWHQGSYTETCPLLSQYSH